MTSAFFRGVGVKNWPNLATDSSTRTSEITADGSGVGVKNCENLPTS